VNDRPQRVLVDRLVLQGFHLTPAQGRWLRARVEAELQSLLAQEGLPESGSGEGETALAAAIARGVAGALRGSG
jgi:hypothetical protein